MPTVQGWFAGTRELPRSNAAESILNDLRAGIGNSEIEVGARLPSEAALARHYGVSRPVVREALRSAQALGLTRTRTGSGTFVVSDTPRPPERFSSYSYRDLMEARPSFEVLAARLAAQRRSDRQATELIELCTRMEAQVQPREWVQLDSLFHGKIAEASGNRVFLSVVTDIRDALAQQSEVINLLTGRRVPSTEEHREIAEAIAGRDPDRAERAMRVHLEYVEAVVRPMIREE